MTTLAFNSDADRRDFWIALAQDRAQIIAEMSAVLRDVMAEYPAFRSKPMGAPGSFVRDRQDRQIALEDRIKKAIKRAAP